MTHPADDKRALFQRVVDDIIDQIRTGTLHGGDALPTARKMAESYGVASMTAQRALRELQHLGLTYAVVGKGTFVHPLARERAGTEGQPNPARGDTMADDPDLNRRVAQFLLKQNEIAGRIVDAMMAKDVHGMNVATQELADLKAANQDLADDIAKYEANAGTPAASEAAAPEPTKPRRARKPTK
ncbi:winged helix-turn-helix domain-containing protein [Actinoplanes sp. NPDC051851]|uniref:GntR family transcriptional regulator n=1 Tax=Actinoplanes sp. NPDC051851 TaxID=3154753 RepID=UPI003437AA9B